MTTIYSNIIGLKLKNAFVLRIDELNNADIIRDRRLALIRNATLPEKTAASIFNTFEKPPIRQAYFRIRRRSYFLDFFFPDMLLAVEIDGSSHAERKEYDRRRDADFRLIGIKTVRIKNQDVMNGKLNEKLFKRLYK